MSTGEEEALDGEAEAGRRIELALQSRSCELDLSALGLTEVPKRIVELTEVVHLSLAQNLIGPNGVQPLVEMRWLSTLNLGGNHVGDGGAEVLSGLSGLKGLFLSYNHLGAAGAQSLSNLHGLETLRLEYNRIGFDGARSLFSLTKLKVLTLAGNLDGHDATEVRIFLQDLITSRLAQSLTTLKLGDEGQIHYQIPSAVAGSVRAQDIFEALRNSLDPAKRPET